MLNRIISVIMGLFMTMPGAGTDAPLMTFSYSFMGMALPQIEGMGARRTEEGCFADFYLGFAENIENVPISAEDFGKLESIIDDYEIRSWAGFDEVNTLVLDGESFTLSAVFDDGTQIDAHGSNSFPQGYWYAKDAILLCIEEIMENNGIEIQD